MTKHTRVVNRKKYTPSLIWFFALLVALPLLVAAVLYQTVIRSKAASGYPRRLRVIEVRYIPQTPLYAPDSLSVQLQTSLRQASISHKGGVSAIDPEIVAVYNHATKRPNPDGTWEGSYRAILANNNLCQQIHDQKIDQIWLWVDPRIDTAPGLEYVISSPMFQQGSQFATVASPAFCNGQHSFTIMGFDDSRPADNALHSFGHMMEGLLGNLQTVELFWYRFAGNPQTTFPLTTRCGNVHFPPNATADYEYAKTTTVTNNFCDDWHPDGTGATTSVTCQTWGCTQQGFLTWWMKHFPNKDNTLQYQSQTLPNWWDFIVDMDYVVPYYYNNPTYFMNRAFLNLNQPLPNVAPRTPLPTPTPASTMCVGQCKGDAQGTSYPSGRACIGMDNLCYLCGSNGNFSVVAQSACVTPTPTPKPPTPTQKSLPTVGASCSPRMICIGGASPIIVNGVCTCPTVEVPPPEESMY